MRARPYLALGAAIIAISTAAVLISLALGEGAPAIAIAALRMGFAAMVAVPLACCRARSEISRLPRRDILLCILSGALLALHFASWTSSLETTSVMSSVVFVSTNPVFVGIASAIIFREKLGAWTVAGIVVAAAGGVVVGLVDFGQAGTDSLRGDVLAILGALAGSGYLLVGRRLRSRMSLTAYVGIAYGTAAILLLALAAVTGTPLGGFSVRGWLWIGLLAAGPQLIGHTSYNWALRYVSATFVTVALLAEPVGATLLAIPVLGQVPEAAPLAGGALILAGIVLAARAEARGNAGLPRGKEVP
jgi:drug/metabolite transporter (DMT)-like permease